MPRRILQRQSTHAGTPQVAYPTIKRLLIHIFALCPFKIFSNTGNLLLLLKYSTSEGLETQNLWLPNLCGLEVPQGVVAERDPGPRGHRRGAAPGFPRPRLLDRAFPRSRVFIARILTDNFAKIEIIC